jgi:hypothetical protein
MENPAGEKRGGNRTVIIVVVVVLVLLCCLCVVGVGAWACGDVLVGAAKSCAVGLTP